MSYEDKNLAELVREIKQASTAIAEGDWRINKRIDDLGRSINELYLKTDRPGGGWRPKTTRSMSARTRSGCVGIDAA